MKVRVNPSVTSLAVTGVLAASFTLVSAQQRTSATVAIDADDIGGVVASSAGAESGVWVIAETTDLPTKFARMVVTDDQGHYVLPDLPQASYQVFVRGYGLVDSARVAAKPGQHVDLKAVVAPRRLSNHMAASAIQSLGITVPQAQEPSWPNCSQRRRSTDRYREGNRSQSRAGRE